MKTVNMHEAKTHLSRLVQAVREGSEREVVIAVGGVPAARLVPYTGPPRRLLGIDRGLVAMADDFDAPDARIAAWFEGEE
ncbi:MAG: type II toxin-antitoxin system prevent-host-death family antitoxin [Candidatus Baltobacteraceae bacterium]